MPLRRLSPWCCLAIAAWQLLLSTAITLHHRHEGGSTAHQHHGGPAVQVRETPLDEPAHAHLILLGLEFFLGEEDESTPSAPTTPVGYAVEMGFRPAGQAEQDRWPSDDSVGTTPAALEPASFELVTTPVHFVLRTDRSRPPARSIALLATDDALRI
jgi:hypothetical protein